MALAAVVLAAGRAERMGSPKALLDFRGQPLVIRVLEALEALELRPRIVVLGRDAARIRPVLAGRDCLVVENPDVAGGPIGSLRTALTALKALRPAGILVWPVDRPHVRVATVERLLQACRRAAAPAVIPTFAERRGHPGIWDQALFDELATSGGATRRCAQRPRAAARHRRGRRPRRDRRPEYAGGLREAGARSESGYQLSVGRRASWLGHSIPRVRSDFRIPPTGVYFS